MAKRTRHPESVKWLIAERYNNGEDIGELAKEYNIAASTVKDYGKQFPSKPRKVKRRVIAQPKENTRVFEEAETKGLREENQRLRNLLLDEILRNRNAS